MDDAAIVKLTISELAPMIESKQISPVEVTNAALAQVDRLQPTLNSFITVLGEQAMTQAKDREREVIPTTGHLVSLRHSGELQQARRRPAHGAEGEGP